jgi:hypothetical protein
LDRFVIKDIAEEFRKFIFVFQFLICFLSDFVVISLVRKRVALVGDAGSGEMIFGGD